MGALVEGPHPASVTRVTLTGNDGAAVEAIVAQPDEGSPPAGLVVHPDVMGVRPLFDDLCRRLATHGYAVACPEPFAEPPRASLREQYRRVPERHHCAGATAPEAEEEYPERKTAQHTGGDHRCRTPREDGDNVLALIPERRHIQRQRN